MTNYQTKKAEPSAWISIEGGRKKIYDDKFIYLSDNQQFEIELYNPTSHTYLTKIKLNSEYISSSGLVLRPGERHVLKRFLDKDKVFLFKTYEVEADNQEVEEAISQNGKVKVEFYQKVEPIQIYNVYPDQYYQVNKPWNNNIIYCNTVDTNQHMYNLNSTFTSTADFSTNGFNLSDTVNCSHTSENTKKEETGTVEAGNKTGQTFGAVDLDFSNYCAHTTEYQILPTSKQPIVKEDIKNYCSNCGKKCKHIDNFCPKCGTKINQD